MENISDGQECLFDMELLKKRRAKATFLGFEDFIHKLLVDDLRVRLNELDKKFDHPLLIGPFLSNWSASLPNPTFEESSDLDVLQLKKNYDLIIHCLCLHWSNDPLGKLIQMKRSLKPGGLLMGYLFGEGTLRELRTSFNKAEIELEGSLSLRVVPMVEIKSIGNLLGRAGFEKTVSDLITHKVHYSELRSLFSDLRRMGETNALRKQKKTFLRRSTYEKMITNYQEEFLDFDGKFITTFNIICFTGWKKQN